MSAALLVCLGLLAGAGATLGALRATRVPGSPLYDLRIRLLPLPFANDPESKWLAETYGPERYSEGIEEWIIRDFFQDERGGKFVDVGSADYKTLSNTFYLETKLGWSGIAIDAQDSYRGGYTRHRPRTAFFTFFVSNESSKSAKLFIGDYKFVASAEKSFTDRWGNADKSIEVPTITLNDLLDAQGIAHVDFVSMDIELHEPQALAGFEIARFKPGLVCVEAHPEVRQQLVEYFGQRGYVIAAKYLRADAQNIWFMPAGTVLPPFPTTASLH
jgi:hypothetical protein